MEQVKLFSLIWVGHGMMAQLANLENEMNVWLKSQGDKIEIIRVLNQNYHDQTCRTNVITYSVFYKEKSKTKTEAPPEIRISRNAY